MIYITRKFHFSASHKVSNPLWSEEENMKVYGKCANPGGHGHNYILEVTVAGEVDPKTGFVMDLKELNDLLEKDLMPRVDHRNLNTDVDFMNGVNPTTENLAVKIWNEIEGNITNGTRRLYSIKLFETEKNFVEYRGE